MRKREANHCIYRWWARVYMYTYKFTKIWDICFLKLNISIRELSLICASMIWYMDYCRYIMIRAWYIYTFHIFLYIIYYIVTVLVVMGFLDVRCWSCNISITTITCSPMVDLVRIPVSKVYYCDMVKSVS